MYIVILLSVHVIKLQGLFDSFSFWPIKGFTSVIVILKVGQNVICEISIVDNLTIKKSFSFNVSLLILCKFS